MKASLFLILLLATSGFPVNSNDKKEDVLCLSVSTVYAGRFQNIKTEQSFDAQFHLMFEINDSEQRLFVTRHFWNQTLSTTDGVTVAWNTANAWERCYSFNKTCSIPFNKESKYVQFALIHMGPWFVLNLLQMNSNNGVQFILNNTVGGCTKFLPSFQAPDPSSGQPDSTLYSMCACCGEYKPDKSLNCPDSPFQNALIKKPAPPSQTTTAVSATKDELICQAVTVYYTGIFANPTNASESFEARFQNKYEIDAPNRRVLFTNQHWDQTISKSANFYFTLYNGTRGSTQVFNNKINCNPLKQGCSMHFGNGSSWVGSFIVQSNPKIYLKTFHTPNALDGFVLKNVTGRCTNSLIQDPNQSYNNPDWEFYRVCACCGDYAPHPALLCPDNPWQTHTSQ